MPNEKMFSYIMARSCYISWDDDDVHFAPTRLIGFS